MLPNSPEYGFNPDIISECECFTRDLAQKHDDICFVAGTKVATLFGYKNIEDIKKGDWIITPYGLNKVKACGLTGISETIKVINNKLECTPAHKIFVNNTFDKACNLVYDVKVDTLNYKGLLKWKYKQLLYSMELNIDLWGRRGIILASQQQMKDEDMLKDFMLQFGN